MACATVEECLSSVADAIRATSTAPDGLDVANTVLTLLIAAAAVAVAYRVFRFDRNRTLAADREELRLQLRQWYQSISRSASDKLKDSRERLRSAIEEVADAEAYRELLTLMRWAVAMEDASYHLETTGVLSEQSAKNSRVIVKRRFRQFIAVWSRKPAKGAKLIRDYTDRGWPAIASEPEAAVRSAQALRPKKQWKTVPRLDRINPAHWDHGDATTRRAVAQAPSREDAVA